MSGPTQVLFKALDGSGNLYASVPKEQADHIAYRRKLLAECRVSKALRETVKEACRRDILFWVNSFIFVHEPRPGRGRARVIPCNTWPFQDDVILRIQRGIRDGHDVVIKKSRDMTATWDCLITILHLVTFEDWATFLVGSRKEEYVDKSDDMKALMCRLMFMVDHQPGWMYPEGVNRTFKHLANPATHSTIEGEATVGDFGRGDRRTAILLDEFAAVPDGWSILAATRDSTKCRIINSTSKGMGTAFYKVCRDFQEADQIRLHWRLHPLKSAGMETDAKGKLTSPWYRSECARAGSPREIAEELDMDDQAAGGSFYPADVLERIRQTDIRPPLEIGQIVHEDIKRPLFVSAGEAEPAVAVKLWLPIIRGERPPVGRYALGVDSSTGAGASNSCICGVDLETGEQFLEYADPYINPADLAHLAVAMANWLRGPTGEPAYIIWETGGPGGAFGRRIQAEGHVRVYYRRSEEDPWKPATDKPGWAPTPSTISLLHSEFRLALKDGQFIIRSEDMVNELEQYAYLTTGIVGHQGAHSLPDPSGARSNHGDRAVAGALCWKLCQEFGFARKVDPQDIDEMAWLRKTPWTPGGARYVRRQIARAREKEPV